MCGIAGYIGKNDAKEILYECIKRLEYRGYDSYGYALISSDKLFVEKDIGYIKPVSLNITSNIGIAHTRWATHGKVSKNNAHPHLSCNGFIAVVHNGIIKNFKELREYLIKRGHEFKSETDTEVVAHLIEEFLKEGNFEEAFRKAILELKGSFAIAAIYLKEPDKILVARNENPLLIGLGKDENFVASDVNAFLKYTKLAVALDDYEYGIVYRDKFIIKNLYTGKIVKKNLIKIDWDEDSALKEGFEHFMLKEIHEEPRVISTALNINFEEKIFDILNKSSNIYIIGAGTSLHAGMHAEYWFSKFCKRRSIAIDSTELLEKGVIDKNSLIIAISQSGETYDTLAAMKEARKFGAKIISIVNVPGTTATRLSDYTILQGAGIEVAVCATKTYVSQLVILIRLILEYAKRLGLYDGYLDEELHSLRKKVEDVLNMSHKIKEIAYDMFNVRNYLFLSRGVCLPSAYEAALKLKEITYLHAEGMSSAMLKHGTISLIDENMETIFLIPSKGKNRDRILSNLYEVKSRGGRILAISPKEVKDVVNILVPDTYEELLPIIFAPAYQLLSYYVAYKYGREIDKPRHLAKSVTVE